MFYMTIFTSRFDNKTDKGFGYPNWNGFVDGLKELSEIPREKKEDAPLMSMAVFKKDNFHKVTLSSMGCWRTSP